MVGYRYTADSIQAFMSAPITFADPVPALMRRGTALITTVPDVLAKQGRRVEGIAADGVSQIVVRIPMNSPQQSVTVKVYQSPTLSSLDMKRYGALGKPGEPCPGTGCNASEVTVQASTTTDGTYMAFVVYRAPVDFASPGDEGLKSRDVYLRVELPSSVKTIPLKIVRPPVALVHGMWSNVKDTWGSFIPLAWGVQGSDPRFAIMRIEYGQSVPLNTIVSTSPFYASPMAPTYSSFGIDVNARRVFDKVREEINRFKDGANPLRIPVAAVQADFVTHSMGGNIARYLPRVETPAVRGQTFDKGVVHKLIAVAAPHLGSPVGRRFLQAATDGNMDHRCFADFIAEHGNFAFDSAVLTDFGPVKGAAGDLRDTPKSEALNDIASTAKVRSIPTALLVGTYEKWWSLQLLPTLFRRKCKHDPMAAALNKDEWPVLMGGASDGIVPVTSAHPQGPGIPFPNSTHSDGMMLLGFEPPTMTTQASVPTTVIYLLNISLTDLSYYGCLPGQAGQCGQ